MFDTSVLDSIVGQIAVVDATGRVVAENRGWRETAVHGQLAPRPWNYLDECNAAAQRGCAEAKNVEAGIREVLARQRDAYSMVYACPYDRKHHWFKVTVSRAPEAGFAIVAHTDVTELQVDALTGLANKAFFDSHLSESLRIAAASVGTVGVVLIDLDRFKAVNDKYGHVTGDAVLRSFASKLASSFREGDLVARIGGDEFGVVLAAGTSRATTDWLTDKIGASLRTGRHHGKIPEIVTASSGAAFYPDDGLTAEELISAADRRMYGVKRKARG